MVCVELDERDLRLLHRALRYHVGKLRREAEKSTFVPEPGKVDVTKRTLEHGENLLDRLRTAQQAL